MSKDKNQNAVKHGVFAEVVILPGEDVKEFEELHQSLINEWGPDGPTEHDAVSTLAKCVWRKRRLVRYQQKEIATWEDGKSKVRRRGEEVDRDLKLLVRFKENVDAGELITERDLATSLGSVAWAEYFTNRFPRKNYSSDYHWLEAIVHDIDKEVMPFLRDLDVLIPIQLDGKRHKEQVFFNGERTAQELALEERIDTMIDKTIKRLWQIKTAKDIAARFHYAPIKNEVLKQVESPNIRMVEREEDNQ
jgi:hypothetical protein